VSEQNLIDFAYVAAAVLFIYGLKMLSSRSTARRGNRVSAIGMLLAVVATLFNQDMDYRFILVGVLVGGLVGAVAAMRVAMTSMPELVALFNGFGGIASLLVGWAEYQRNIGSWAAATQMPASSTVVAIWLAVFIGGVTFSGSMIACAKLARRIPGTPVGLKHQQLLNAAIVLGALVCGTAYIVDPVVAYTSFLVTVGLAFILGVFATLPIGGADMPVVISLLNSCSGLAACAAGFAINNMVLIVSGALVGASGLVLTGIMCKAMNRSLSHVLFSGFAPAGAGTSAGQQGETKPITAEDAYYLLEAARSIAFVPGYGMAVAQAALR